MGASEYQLKLDIVSFFHSCRSNRRLQYVCILPPLRVRMPECVQGHLTAGRVSRTTAPVPECIQNHSILTVPRD